MNQHQQELQIGINASSLLTPLTGIGRYTLNLALELEKNRSLSLAYFYGLFWSERCYGDGREEAARVPQSNRKRLLSPPTLVAGLRDAMKAVIPKPYELSRFLQQRVFSAGARTRRLRLYHDPNFIPYRFEGKTVITVHDLSLIKYPETHPQARIRAIGRRLPDALARADAVIVVANSVRAEVIETFGTDPQKVFAIHNGVSPHYRPLSREEIIPVLQAHGLGYKGYILNVGTREPRKNLIRLTAAYRLLPPALQNRYPLVVVGMKGWHCEPIEHALGLLVRSGHARVPGYVPETQLPAIYAGAALLVYPSLYEGFGLPLVEAMAVGTPVIASNRSSMPEVVGDAGILVEPEDEVAIADAIRRLLEDRDEVQRLQQLGLERVQHFTWKRCAERTAALYRRVLESGGSLVE